MRSCDCFPPSPPPYPPRQAGFTLLEVTASVVLMTVVVGAALVLSLRAQDLYGQLNQRFILQETGLRILDRVGNELRRADPDSIDPVVLDSSPEVSFRMVTGFSDDAIEYGPTLRYFKNLAAGEVLNGLDDNGDGRNDEGQFLYQVVGLDPVVLADDVLDFRFNSTANGIEMEISLGIIDRDGELVSLELNRRVSFRN